MNGPFVSWVRAARPLALANIWPPLLAGWWVAGFDGAPGGTPWLVLLLLAGWLDQLAIVLLNEVADVDADRRNPRPTLFSGGSRVLLEQRLSARAVRNAGLAAATGFWTLCLAAAVIRGDWRIAALALAGLGLLQAYSFRPLRLNYEGGGELLQAAGCGLVLPALGILLAGGRLAALGPDEWLGLFLLAMAGALATTLTDAPADRMAGKETLAARFGTTATSLLAVASAAMALVLLEGRLGSLALVGLAVLPGLVLIQRAVFRYLRKPDTEDSHGWNHAAAVLLLLFTLLGWFALGPWLLI